MSLTISPLKQVRGGMYSMNCFYQRKKKIVIKKKEECNY